MPDAWIPLLLTLKVALWATSLNLVLGVAAGFAMARLRFPGREVLARPRWPLAELSAAPT